MLADRFLYVCIRFGAAAMLVLSLLAASATAFGEEPVSQKALKYHELLVKRPEPGYLFDRFYNTWLDESTVDALEAFLTKRAQESHETGDQLLLAFLYEKKGDDVAALEKFREALATNPANAATWYHKSLVEARTLDFDSAIVDLKKAREQSPDGKLALQIDKQLGKLLARNRQAAEAQQVWEALLAAHPKDDELAEDLIELQIDEGLLKEAAASTEALIGRTQDPYLAVMRRLRLGDIRHRGGDREKAVEVYTVALGDIGAGTWLEREILAQVDQMFRREDDLTGLKRLFDSLAEKYADRVAIHRRRAQLLLEASQNDEALAAFREVLKLTPGDRATREEYITMLAKIGKQDEAVKELEALCEQNQKDAELRFRLAELCRDAKQADEASAAIDQYLAAADQREYSYLRAARLLERFENKEPAERIYVALAEKFADSPSAQDAYAAFLYGQGRKEDAVKRWLAQAEKADLNQLLHVSRTLASRGEQQSAFDLLVGRRDEFAKETPYLNQLVTTALALKKFDDAIPWVLQRVELAEAAPDLETAIEQAATTIERADKLQEIATQLTAQEERSVATTCLLAELRERIGETAAADELLKKLSDSGNVLAVAQQIRLCAQRRDWAGAAEATRHLLELPGGRKSLHVRRLVELYQRDYQLEEALKWIDEWKRLSPGSSEPWVTEARLIRSLGKSEDALRVLRTAVQRFDQDENLRVRLAEFYVETDKPADAERIYWQLYDETEDLNGKLRWAQELSKLSQQQGTTQQIVESFKQRAESNRQSIVPLLALSEVYRQTDDYENRRRALSAASKIKPDDIYLLQQIARIDEQDGDWKAAVATLERALPLDKTNRTREQIARLHLQYGEEDTGFTMLLGLVAGADADPRTLESIADTLCAMQEWQRAADFLQGHMAAYPTDYRLRYLLATALEEASQTSAAIAEFEQLLDGQEELVGKQTSTATAAGPLNRQVDVFQKILPPQALEWFQLMQSRYTAYSHRQRGNMRAVVSLQAAGPGGPRSAIQLPPNVDAVRSLALAHLVSIMGTLDEEPQRELCHDLELHGVQHAAALAHIDPNRGDFQGAITEVLDKEPEDETALAIYVLQRMGQRDESANTYCANAVEKFRESRPQLAFMAALQAGIQDAKADPVASIDDATETPPAASNKYFDEALKLASAIDTPNPYVVMSITTALGGGSVNQAPSPVAESYRKQLAQLLVDWYPELSRTPMYGSWAFFSAAQTLSSNSDPTAFIRFLDEEIARNQSGGNSSQSARNLAAQFGGQRNQRLFLKPLSFPPTQLADFPAHVLMAFATQENGNPYGRSLQLSADEGFAEKLKPLLKDVKNPILRVLLAHRAELNEEVDSEIASLIGSQSPQLDVLLLAAGRATEKEDIKRAAELLQKAHYLPMKQEMRTQVDAALVASVVGLKESKKDVGDELLDAGRQASLRLRRARMDANQRNELIAAMEELGLKKEAAKLDELASTTSAAPSRSPQVFYSAPGPQNTGAPDRVAKLISDGKRDEAVRAMVAEVTPMVKQRQSSPQMMRGNRYQFRQIKQRVEGLGMVDELLKAMEPGESRNIERIRQYAFACQVLERDELARKSFEQLVELKPKDDVARMQLILLSGGKDREAAAAQIKLLNKQSRDQLGQQLSEQLQNFEATFDERLAAASVAAEFFKLLEEGDVTQTYWVESIVQSVGGQMHNNRGNSMLSLYALPSTGRSSDNRKKRPELTAERQTIHEEMCTALLTNRQLARVGFVHSLAAAESRRDSLDAFGDHARQILIDEADAKPSRAGSASVQTVYYSSTNVRDFRFRSPEEFLARRAWQSGDWALIDDTLLPKLATGKTREAHDRLERLSTLYRCDEDQFVEKARDITTRSRSQQNQQNQPNAGLAISVDVWAERGLAADLQPLVLRELKQDVQGQNHYQAPGYLTRFVEGAASKWDRDRQLALFDDLATIYLAPPGKRNDFISKNYQRNNISWGTPNGRIYVFVQWMEQLCQQRELLFVVLEHLEQYDPQPVQNLTNYVQSTLNKTASEGAEPTLQLLISSPWLQDVDKFQSLIATSESENAPLVGLLKKVSAGKKKKEDFQSLLQSRQDSQPTFGGALILAYLDQGKAPAGVLTLVAENLASIQALPEDRQNGLAVLLTQMIPAGELSKSDLSNGSKAAKEWLESRRAGNSVSLLDKVNKAKRLEDLGLEIYQLDDFARKNLRELIDDDPKTCVTIFQRLCELARETQRTGNNSIYLGNGESTEGWILNSLSNGLPQSWKTYLFIADVINNDKQLNIEASYGANNICGKLVDNSLNRAEKDADGKPPEIDGKLRAFYNEFGAALDGRPGSLIVPSLYDRLNGQLDEQSCDKVLAWADEEMAGGKFPYLASDIHAVASFIAAEKNSDEQKHFTAANRRPLAAYHEHFRQLINSDQLPLTWRINLATFAALRQPESLPLELARDVVALHAGALAAGVPIVNEQNERLAIVVQSLEDDPAAADALSDWREKWADRYLKPKRPRNPSQGQTETLFDLSSPEALCTALEMYLAAHEQERVDRFLQKYADQIGGLPQSLAILIRGEQSKKAADMLRRNWPRMQLTWPDRKSTRYDEAFVAAVEPVYEELAAADQRYFAHLLFASMPDPKSGGEVEGKDNAKTASPERDQRLVELANRYAEINFADRALKKRALVLLSRNNVAGKLVVEAVAAEYKPENVLSALGNRGGQTPRLEQEIEFASCHLRNRAREGDCAPLAELLARMVAGTDADDYQFGQNIGRILDCCRDALREPGEAWPTDQCAAIAKSLRDLFKDRDHVNINDYRSFNALFAAMHSQGNARDAAEDWLKSTSTNTKNQIQNQGTTHDVWKFGARLNGPATPDNLEARRNFVKNALRIAADRKWIRWKANQPQWIHGDQQEAYFAVIVNSGLLSHEELREHGRALVESIGNTNDVTAPWAAWLKSAKHTEEAAAAWRMVVDATLGDSDGDKPSIIGERGALYVIELINCQRELGQYDPALETVKRLEACPVPNKIKPVLVALKDELSKEQSDIEPEQGNNDASPKPAPPAEKEDEAADAPSPSATIDDRWNRPSPQEKLSFAGRGKV